MFLFALPKTALLIGPDSFFKDICRIFKSCGLIVVFTIYYQSVYYLFTFENLFSINTDLLSEVAATFLVFWSCLIVYHMTVFCYR